MPKFEIRAATEADVPLILSLIKELAEYERLSHEVVATEEALGNSLFGERPVAEVVIGHLGDGPVGFALFFHTFSTFLAKPGIYLEDLYVKPRYRGMGFGRALLVHLARLARERGCGRFEWSVLDWNEPAIGFYRSIGASPVSGWTVYRLSGEALDELAANG
jgi:GNAT superfamily N-acetyltransferase